MAEETYRIEILSTHDYYSLFTTEVTTNWLMKNKQISIKLLSIALASRTYYAHCTYTNHNILQSTWFSQRVRHVIEWRRGPLTLSRLAAETACAWMINWQQAFLLKCGTKMNDLCIKYIWFDYKLRYTCSQVAAKLCPDISHFAGGIHCISFAVKVIEWI